MPVLGWEKYSCIYLSVYHLRDRLTRASIDSFKLCWSSCLYWRNRDGEGPNGELTAVGIRNAAELGSDAVRGTLKRWRFRCGCCTENVPCWVPSVYAKLLCFLETFVGSSRGIVFAMCGLREMMLCLEVGWVEMKALLLWVDCRVDLDGTNFLA